MNNSISRWYHDAIEYIRFEKNGRNFQNEEGFNNLVNLCSYLKNETR